MTAIPPENNGSNKFQNSFAKCWMPIQKNYKIPFLVKGNKNLNYTLGNERNFKTIRRKS